jgi:IS4 transposase
LNAITIANIYKRRWQIECLFKRLKQNYPLKYFLGDNENAIKIQIWSALITDLLIKVVKEKVKRKWSFSNIAAMIRLHLMTYIYLIKFLQNPEKALRKYSNPNHIFPT